MLRIAICDDNNAICSEVEEMILEYKQIFNEDLEIHIFNLGMQLLNFIESQHDFDLIFLDIEIGDMTGIDVGSKIRNGFDDYISKIVFMTSKNGYEQSLFDVQPLNFIKKPVSKEKVHKCLDLCLKLLGRENEVFEYKKDYDVIRVKVKDILYFEKVGRKIKITTNNGEDFFNESLANVKAKLPHIFLKPYNSFLINFEKIQIIKNDKIIMFDKKEIPVSRRNLQNIRTMLLDSEKEK